MTVLYSTANDNHSFAITMEKVENYASDLASSDGQSVSVSYDFDLDKLEEEIDYDISISSSSDDDGDDERFIPFRLNDIDFPSSSSKSQRRKQEQEGGKKKKPRRVSKSRLRELQDAVERDTEKLQQKKIAKRCRQQQTQQCKNKQTSTTTTKLSVQLQQGQPRRPYSRRFVTPGKQNKIVGTTRCSLVMTNNHAVTSNTCYRGIRQQT